jgi:hypothetical protein
MFPRCRTKGPGFAVPPLVLRVRDVEGFRETRERKQLRLAIRLIVRSFQGVV